MISANDPHKLSAKAAGPHASHGAHSAKQLLCGKCGSMLTSSGWITPTLDEDDEALLQALAALQSLSKINEPRHLFKIATDFILAPLTGASRSASGSEDAHAVLVVSDEGLDPGSYRVTRRLVSTPHGRMMVEAFEDETQSPVLSGGVVGQLLKRRRPQIVRELRPKVDDPLAPDLEGFDECLVLPVFQAGRLTRRYLIFRDHWRDPDIAAVERGMLLAGFIETSISNMLSARTQEVLYRGLSIEMERVQRLQRHLLPKSHPERTWEWAESKRACPGVEVGMAYRPAERAGGDYFQLFPLSPERLGLLVADVSGHNADAAMIMSMVHAIARGDSPMRSGPGAALAHLNDRIHPLLMEGQFVTAAAVEIDLGTGKLRYATAAHPAPRLCRAARDGMGALTTALDQAGGGLIGLEVGMEFPQAEVDFGPGDRVVAYTDGLIDSLAGVHTGAKRAGEEHLDQHLAFLERLDAPGLCAALLDLAIGRDAREQIDDVTVVALGRALHAPA